jgi:molecular chaperone HtpG
VRLYRTASADEVEAARGRARETLEYWCKHVRIELRLDGERVSGEMDVAGLCRVEHAEEGTRLVMALVPEAAGLRGYYHGGLTLHEERDEVLPHVAFKIDSRYLEHSLTRDNVIRDENYAKAMTIVGEVARTRLAAALVAALERCAAGGTMEASARALLYRCAARHLSGGEAGWLRAALVPMLGEPPAAPGELRARGRKLWRARVMSPVVERLVAQGQRVVACAAGDEVEGLVFAAVGERPAGTEGLCTAVAIDAGSLAGWAALREAMARLIKAAGWKVREVAVGSLNYADSPVADRLAISQAEFGELTPVAEAGELASGWLTRARVLVLSAEHPTLLHLRAVAGREPELAAYLAIKAFFLHGELGLAVDARLATAAAEARWRRTAT